MPAKKGGSVYLTNIKQTKHLYTSDVNLFSLRVTRQRSFMTGNKKTQNLSGSFIRIGLTGLDVFAAFAQTETNQSQSYSSSTTS